MFGILVTLVSGTSTASSIVIILCNFFFFEGISEMLSLDLRLLKMHAFCLLCTFYSTMAMVSLRKCYQVWDGVTVAYSPSSGAHLESSPPLVKHVVCVLRICPRVATGCRNFETLSGILKFRGKICLCIYEDELLLMMTDFFDWDGFLLFAMDTKIQIFDSCNWGSIGFMYLSLAICRLR